MVKDTDKPKKSKKSKGLLSSLRIGSGKGSTSKTQNPAGPAAKPTSKTPLIDHKRARSSGEILDADDWNKVYATYKGMVDLIEKLEGKTKTESVTDLAQLKASLKEKLKELDEVENTRKRRKGQVTVTTLHSFGNSSSILMQQCSLSRFLVLQKPTTRSLASST